MSGTTIFEAAQSGSILLNDVSVTETDAGGDPNDFLTFASNFGASPVPLLLYSAYQAFSTMGNVPLYDGVEWGGLNVNVSADDPSSPVAQTVTPTADVSAVGGGVIIGSLLEISPQGLTPTATISATETFTDVTSGNTLASATYSGPGVAGNYLSLGGSSTNVAASVTITDQIAAGSPAADVGFSNVSLAFVEGDVSIVKQVSVDGGATWLTIAPGATSDGAQALLGCPVEYQVIVTNDSSNGVTFTGSVTDTGIAGLSGFTFGGSSTLTLASGSSETSAIVTVAAGSTNDVFDTATVTGTVSDSNGDSGTVTASSSADVTGVSGSVAIDKQVSTDGVTWENVATLNSFGTFVPTGATDPTATDGSTLYYRVVVANTGSVALGNLAVSDALAPGSLGTVPADFTFSTNDPAGTLAVGQIVTSDIATGVAGPGANFDVATVTAKAVIADGTSSTGATLYTNSICDVTSSATAEYTGVVSNTPNGSISIDKQVSVDCGKTWEDVGVGVLNDPTATIGAMVEFRVIVTDTGSTDLSNVTVSDSGHGDITGFTFGGLGSIATLDPGTADAVTSDIAMTPALSGYQLDTAEATGTVVGGGSVTVTASDTADYTGVKGNITIDKEVSTNGTTWYDVGSGVLNNVTTLVGDEVYFRVIVTDTGTTTLTGVKVTDVGNGAPSGFTFGSRCVSTTSIAAGQSITSNVAGVCALVGYNTDTATVTGSITTGGSMCGTGGTTTIVGACDIAAYTGVNGSISIEKLVSVNGGTSWEQYSSANAPQALMGASVEFEVIVTDTGTTALTGVTVSDAGGGAVTGFTFGTSDSTSISLIAGQSVTSNAGSTVALCGLNTDTATATGSVVVGSGTATVSASSKADYQGISGGISILKEVSVDGGKTWEDVGNNCSDPTATVGSTVEFRVVVTNTGPTAITGIKVSDTGNFSPGDAISSFVFAGTEASSLAIGQSITSDVASTTALSGNQVDTAEVTGTVSVGGATATVTAIDTAEYCGGSSGSSSGCGTGGSGSGWGGSGGCGGGWGSSGGGTSNGYGCGGDSSGNLCNEYGQAQQIQFCYSPSDCVSQQGLQSGLACVSGNDSCGNAFIEVSNCANAYQSGAQVYYEGNVCTGQDFTANCGSGGSFSGDLYVHCFSSEQAFDQHQSACQTDSYCANGSQSICLGDQVGCATVVGYVGHTGGYCV
jgi:uncharacterized repeat protein (TIGR01451 family)